MSKRKAYKAYKQRELQVVFYCAETGHDLVDLWADGDSHAYEDNGVRARHCAMAVLLSIKK